MADLKKEFQWYLDHQDELVDKYDGRFLVIVNQEVVGDYDSEIEAYFESKEKYGLGNFLLQRCSAGEGDYTATYHSRVRIAYARV